MELTEAFELEVGDVDQLCEEIIAIVSEEQLYQVRHGTDAKRYIAMRDDIKRRIAKLVGSVVIRAHGTVQ